MNGPIDFAGSGFRTYEWREETAATLEAAMYRCFPHIVCWDAPHGHEPAVVHLPAGMNRDELLNLARRECVTFATPSGDRDVVELHFGHLAPSEAEEGIARLGRAMVSYIDGADGSPGSGSLLFVGP